jgi:membrane protein
VENRQRQESVEQAMPLSKQIMAKLHRWMELSLWVWRNILRIAFRTDEDHVFMLAAGIAFNFITALVPTVLLMFFILGTLLNTDQETVMRQLNETVRNFNVSAGNRDDILGSLQTQINSLIANRGIAAIFGITGLVWAASALATSIRVAINKILRCREVRHYLIYKLFDISTIALIGLLVFVSILLGPLLGVLMATSDRLGEVLHLDQLEAFVTESINFVTSLLLFFTIFRYMPYQKQSRLIIWVGTVVSTALWQIARYVFSFYLAEFGTFSKIYGAYAFFATTAFWLYYSALVFLIGAEVAYHIKQSRWNARRLFNRISGEES